jgi:hypothetical protein
MSYSLTPVLKVLLQPTGPPGFDLPEPWARFKDLSALAQLCQALRLHPGALNQLYKQIQQLLLAPEGWRWEMKQKEGCAATAGTTAEAEPYIEGEGNVLGGGAPLTAVSGQEAEHSVSLPASQKQHREQEEKAPNARAVAALPESVMDWFGPQAKEEHARAMVGSCSPIQLLLLPVHCFVWLSGADKAACLQLIKVRTTVHTWLSPY